MMGRRSVQIGMQIVDVEMMIPENHLLRKIDRMVRFEFIYELLMPYYPSNGRPSVDPVSMFKMLLVGYLYGIKSERRLVEEVRLNLAYRWFCGGFELHEAISDTPHSAKRACGSGSKAICFRRCFRKLYGDVSKAALWMEKPWRQTAAIFRQTSPVRAGSMWRLKSSKACRAIWIDWTRSLPHSRDSESRPLRRSQDDVPPAQAIRIAAILTTERNVVWAI